MRVGMMKKSFLFLVQFAKVNLGCLLGYAVILVVGSVLTGVPRGAENLFSTYYGTFPMMSMLILFLFAFALCTSNLNLALSFGARRRDFFWGIQGVLLSYTAVCWLLQCVMSAIPGAFGWSGQPRWHMMLSLGGQYLWVFPLACLSLMALGCLCGLTFTRSRLWGTVMIIVSTVVVMAAALLLMVTGLNEFVGLWGDLPLILCVGLAVVLMVSEVVIWRTIFRFVIK